MQVTNLDWDDDNISHIARHEVIPEEVEEVCFSHSSCIETARKSLYYITGQTETGRYLFLAAKCLGHGKARIITARDMDQKEKIRYKKRRK